MIGFQRRNIGLSKINKEIDEMIDDDSNTNNDDDDSEDSEDLHSEEYGNDEDKEFSIDLSKIENNQSFEDLFKNLNSNEESESESESESEYELNSLPELKYLGSDFLGKFDTKISTKSIKKEEKRRQRATTERVIDEHTSFVLYKWLNSGDLTELVGLVSAGKEANVYFGYSRDKKPAAIKIYKKDAHSVRWMTKYIKGDPRFIKVGKSPIQIVYTWAKKEYKNLSRLNNHKISAPYPYKIRDNVLLMSYIGEESGTPAPRLKDIRDFQNINKEISVSIGFIEEMFCKAKLVHGDLSEFNILYHHGKQYLIDVSQAVTILHPEALPFLVRDIKNIWTFWNKIEPNPFNMEDLYYHIIRD